MSVDHASVLVLAGSAVALVALIVFARVVVGAMFRWMGL